MRRIISVMVGLVVFAQTFSVAAYPQNGINVELGNTTNGCGGTNAVVFLNPTITYPSLPWHITVWETDSTGMIIKQWLFSQDFGSLPASVSFSKHVLDYMRVIGYNYDPPSIPNSDYTHVYQWVDQVLQCFASPL